jgi:hypothetical protein
MPTVKGGGGFRKHSSNTPCLADYTVCTIGPTQQQVWWYTNGHSATHSMIGTDSVVCSDVTPYDGVCTAWRGPPELCRYTYELCLSWSKPEGLGLGLELRCAFLPGKPRERRALSGPIAYGCSLSGRLMPAVYYV